MGYGIMRQQYHSFLFQVFICLMFLWFVGSVAEKTCDNTPMLDVMFAVDNTASMGTFISRLRTELPRLMNDFDTRYPKSHFGFVSFNDRWLGCQWAWQSSKNYCARLDLPLTDDKERVRSILKSVNANYGGGAPPEDSLGGLLVAARDPSAGWRPFDPNLNQLRIVILVTDDRYRDIHQDTMDCPGPHQRPNDGDGYYDCRNEDYPTVEQVRDALHAMKIMPLFLTLNRKQQVFEDLRQQLGVGGLSVELSSDSSDIFKVVQAAVDEFACATPIPPTEPPTQPPTEPPTQPPTEPPTQPPTEPPTQPPTEPPTQPPTEPPTKAPATSTPSFSDKETTTAAAGGGPSGVTIGAAAAGGAVGLAAIAGVSTRLLRGGGDLMSNVQGVDLPGQGNETFTDKEQAIPVEEAGYA